MPHARCAAQARGVARRCRAEGFALQSLPQRSETRDVASCGFGKLERGRNPRKPDHSRTDAPPLEDPGSRGASAAPAVRRRPLAPRPGRRPPERRTARRASALLSSHLPSTPPRRAGASTARRTSRSRRKVRLLPTAPAPHAAPPACRPTFSPSGPHAARRRRRQGQLGQGRRHARERARLQRPELRPRRDDRWRRPRGLRAVGARPWRRPPPECTLCPRALLGGRESAAAADVKPARERTFGLRFRH